jgi:hypothetical protein
VPHERVAGTVDADDDELAAHDLLVGEDLEVVGQGILDVRRQHVEVVHDDRPEVGGLRQQGDVLDVLRPARREHLDAVLVPHLVERPRDGRGLAETAGDEPVQRTRGRPIRLAPAMRAASRAVARAP